MVSKRSGRGSKMNKQDEILISKYLDGELSGDELKFVKNLIIEDEEAALHYKMHQDTFSLLTKEYENPSYQAAKKRLENLVTHHKAETDTKAWSLEQIFPFSNLGSILSVNNALVASFSLALAFLIVPTKDVVPTTNNEYAVAVIGFTCNTYTIIGTVSMDPPPPVSPKTIPISRAPIAPYMLRSSNLFL